MEMVFFCTLHPLFEMCENPEFHDLMCMDNGHQHRCLSWHAWLPVLLGVNGRALLGLDRWKKVLAICLRLP